MVEVIVAVAILVALIAVSLTSLISSNNLFVENASYAQYKQIGDAVLAFVADELRYAGSIAVDGRLDTLQSGQERLYISDGAIIQEAGKLYYGNDQGDVNFFGDEFYAGTTLKLFIEGNSSTPVIRVTLMRDDVVAYENEVTLQLPNCSVEGSSLSGSASVITYSQPVIG